MRDIRPICRNSIFAFLLLFMFFGISCLESWGIGFVGWEYKGFYGLGSFVGDQRSGCVSSFVYSRFECVVNVTSFGVDFSDFDVVIANTTLLINGTRNISGRVLIFNTTIVFNVTSNVSRYVLNLYGDKLYIVNSTIKPVMGLDVQDHVPVFEVNINSDVVYIEGLDYVFPRFVNITVLVPALWFVDCEEVIIVGARFHNVPYDPVLGFFDCGNVTILGSKFIMVRYRNANGAISFVESGILVVENISVVGLNNGITVENADYFCLSGSVFADMSYVGFSGERIEADFTANQYASSFLDMYVSVNNTDFVEIRENVFSFGAYAVHIDRVHISKIIGNEFLDMGSCLEIFRTDLAYVVNNSFVNSTATYVETPIVPGGVGLFAIGALDLGKIFVIGNTIVNFTVGLDIVGSQYAEVCHNYFAWLGAPTNITVGMFFSIIDELLAYDNNVTGYLEGILLIAEYVGGTLRDNNIVDCGIGIHIRVLQHNPAVSLLIYRNVFADNNVSALIELKANCSPGNIRWNTTVGNYWSDYNGSDWNRDGIGDTPYIITVSPEQPDQLEPWFVDYRPLIPTNNKADSYGLAVIIVLMAVLIALIFLAYTSIRRHRTKLDSHQHSQLNSN